MAGVRVKLGDVQNMPVEITIKATVGELKYFYSQQNVAGGAVATQLSSAIFRLTRQLAAESSVDVVAGEGA